MADVVIVVGARRGGERVSAAEIRQMVGRAGRKHGGSSCEAYVLVDDEDVEAMEEGLSGDAKFEVSSSLSSRDALMFHVLPEICSGEVQDLEMAKAWWSRSFGAFGGSRPDWGKVLEALEECGAVEQNPLGMVPTETARVSVELYLHPLDVKAWKDAFEELFEKGLERSDAAVAWALGRASTAGSPGDFGTHRHVFGMFKEELPSELEASPGTVANSVLWWSALGGPSVGKMRNRMLDMRRDFGRVGRALERLDKAEDWGMEAFFRELGERMRRGVPEHLSELFRIRGMSKGMAAYLYNVGVKDRDGIREALGELEEDMDEKSMAFLRSAANGTA
jgi:replicative superfamily II helicase